MAQVPRYYVLTDLCPNLASSGFLNIYCDALKLHKQHINKIIRKLPEQIKNKNKDKKLKTYKQNKSCRNGRK